MIGRNNPRHPLGVYTMGVVVRLTGIEAHRIRRYEEGGLVQPSRTNGRQRLYADHEIQTIRQIAEMEDQGINMPGIKAILELKRGE